MNAKIREQSKLDKEYFGESVGGALLEDYLGGLAIKIDLGIEVSEMNRDIAFGMLYRRDYPVKCRKEKKKVTTTAIIIKPSTVMNIKPKVVITTKMNNITPISKKTKATAAITTHKPRSSTTFAPIVVALTYLYENLMRIQVIECWSRIPAPEPKSKDGLVSCKAKFIDEVKDNPKFPISNATKIRRNNDKSWEKLDKIEKEIDMRKNDDATIRFVGETQQTAIKYFDDIDLAYDKMNSTLYEAAFKLKNALTKAEKSNDEEDIVALEIALDEFSKTLLAAVTFDNEYNWAYNSILTVHFKIDMIKNRHRYTLEDSIF
uniref:Uncharacterized protein n=1 Tax=Meloidogyne javanica TaxID=6303 RepID=A0A915LHE5_MELJA